VKNRINNIWDDPRLPVEMREKIQRRAAVYASAGCIMIQNPVVKVTVREYDIQHPDKPGMYHHNVALFVGHIQVICLESKRLDNPQGRIRR
jgi:hypothetical protein